MPQGCGAPLSGSTSVLISQLDPMVLATIVIAALVTSGIHGATGVAGGFLMTAVLASLIGVKAVVPVMSIALLISHSSRALLNARDVDRAACLSVIVTATPCIVLAALLYGRMSSSWIAATLGIVVLISIPLRRIARNRAVAAGRGTLAAVGTVYGALSGVSIGSGMLLIPFMLGYGLTSRAFVATLAVIALTTNITRLAVYGATDLLDINTLWLGLLIGCLTIPGNWIGRSILRRLTSQRHSDLVDVLTLLGALNFLYLAFYA